MYYKIGYVYKDFDKITAADLLNLTHINIAFGVIKDGKVAIGHLMKHRDKIKEYREINPDIKFVLSVGGWGVGGFSAAASTEEGRKVFAGSARAAYDELELDGIDIDWEYPCSSWAGIDSSPDDKFTFTLMIRELRDALPPGAILSIAAGAGEYFVKQTEMDKVAPLLDYVQLMTYDITAGSKFAGHHTNLYAPTGLPNNLSADLSVKLFNNAGVPIEKIIIGAAFYSREWHSINNSENNGLNQAAEGGGGSCAGYTELKNNFTNKNGFVRYWDDNAKAPYLFDGSRFISYDDEESIMHKCRYIKEKGLLGIMYWEHSQDPERNLLTEINNHL